MQIGTASSRPRLYMAYIYFKYILESYCKYMYTTHSLQILQPDSQPLIYQRVFVSICILESHTKHIFQVYVYYTIYQRVIVSIYVYIASVKIQESNCKCIVFLHTFKKTLYDTLKNKKSVFSKDDANRNGKQQGQVGLATSKQERQAADPTSRPRLGLLLAPTLACCLHMAIFVLI